VFGFVVNAARASFLGCVRPKRIILIRHGESESNVNRNILATKPDFAVNLTDKGKGQALEAGLKVKALVDEVSLIGRIWFYCSPFYRTRQTCQGLTKSFEAIKTKVIEDPRLREQEHTPRILKGEDYDMDSVSQERDDYGHFYYRFEGGESCADVYDRVSDFLGTLYRDFEKREFPDVCCIVSHGMTNRVFLMRLLKYTVEEFEFLRNPCNCGMFILNRDDERGKYKLSEPPRRYAERNCKY
jgi:broad specificity phosphatase PhoE